MNDWLYPLSSTSGFYFEMPDRSRTDNTSPANFEASVLRADPNDRWTIAHNYRQVQAGDRVWIYYGRSDGDLGVVGLATVRRIDPPTDGRADVHLRWDRPRTRRLIKNPVNAAEVRAFIWARAAVANLSVHPALVRRLRRRADAADETSRPSQRATVSTITYTPPRQITVHRRHDALHQSFTD